MLLNKVSKIDLEDREYSFNYSNFGFAVLGLVVEEVYQEDYTKLMNTYLCDELQLKNTKVSDGSGDLENYWDWQSGDAYLPAGSITSNIIDMLTYMQMQLDEAGYFEQLHDSVKEINASDSSYKSMGIYIDEIGLSWIIDKKNNIIWHNGGTGDYNSYIGFCPDKQTAVVILSNLSPKLQDSGHHFGCQASTVFRISTWQSPRFVYQTDSFFKSAAGVVALEAKTKGTCLLPLC